MHPSDSSMLVALADEIAERFRRGERPVLDDYLRRFPHLEEHLRELFPALVAMEEFGSVAGQATNSYADRPALAIALPQRLGEYRILREVARGGMGVVYEAVQESLGRHVALKVLPAQLHLSPTHLERFRREACAAARLHHTHIVPVFGVGEDQGVHYYAMQFIHGQSLDSVLRELQRLRAGPAAPQTEPSAGRPAEPAPALALGPALEHARTMAPGNQSGESQERRASRDGVAAPDAAPPPVKRPSDGGAHTPSGNAASTGVVLEHKPRSDARYYRAVAQLGIQVAEALAYAHQQGILHRDIKPANLLLDTHGTVWITDFGLAKSEGADELTSQGDIVGTLRYMAPERFQARADARSDIYSLGLTLYELLTLRPAFAATDKVKLIERVLHDTPTAPRQCDPNLPRDLEVVVLKAMARAPDDRYGAAQDLADDLRRFLEDRPILARRPTLFQRVRKWARRHQAVVKTAAVAFILSVAVLGAMAGWMLHDRDERQRKAAAAIDQEIQARADERKERERRAGEEIERSVREASRLQRQRRWPEALAYAAHAEDILGRVDGQEAWRPIVRELAKDLRMLLKLEEVDLRRDEILRMRGTTVEIGLKRPADHFGPLLRDYGIDVAALAPEAAALEIKRRSIAEPLLAALDSWARTEADATLRTKLRAVIRGVDADGVLARWRAAYDAGDLEKLRRVVVGLKPADVSPIVLSAIGRSAFELGLRTESLDMLRIAHLAHPEEFSITIQLSYLHARLSPPQWSEAARYGTAAVALRPRSADAWAGLGLALDGQGEADGALSALQKAVELAPDLGAAHNNLAVNLVKRGKHKEAEAAFRLAVRDLPSPFIYDNFARLLVKDSSRYKEAEELFDKVLELDSGHAGGYSGRGLTRALQGRHASAMADLRMALKLDPESGEAYRGIGLVLREKKEFPAALKALEEAIRLDAGNLESHYQYGMAYADWGKEDRARGAHAHAWHKFDRAIARFKHIIEMDENHGNAWMALGNASRERGFMKDAIAALERTLQIRPKDARALYNLGNMFRRVGDYGRSMAILDQARAADPDYVQVYANQGAVLLDQGRFAEAEKLLRAGLERKYDPGDALEAILNLAMTLDRQARYAEAIAVLQDGRAKLAKSPRAVAEIEDLIGLYRRFAVLEKRLPLFEKGEARPADPHEALHVAEVCIAARRFAMATAIYQDVFARFPAAANALGDGYRFDAARAAACAGCGLDREKDPARQAAWRKQALAWLRADLVLWIAHAEKTGPNPGTTQALQRWRHHLHLASLRDADLLARLPPAERIKWRLFWNDVAAALDRFPVP